MSEPGRKDLLPTPVAGEASPGKVMGDFINQTLASHSGPAAPPRPSLPWYRQAFQEDYLDLYMHRDLAEAARAVRFLARALGLDGTQRLLDLCCGPGRHLAFLGNFVREAVGLDLSRALLTRAKEHWKAVSGQCGMSNVQGPMSNVNCGLRIVDCGLRPEAGQNDKDQNSEGILIQGDMRHLPLAAGAFDRVVNLFTSFGYFECEDDNAAVLREVARILRPGGLLAMDHINREAMLAHLKPRTERVLPDGRAIVETRRFDGASRRVIKDVVCTEPGGGVKAWCESVRVYEPEELEGMLAAAGLGPVGRYGDYDGGGWNPGAPRLILIGRRGTGAGAGSGD